MRIPTFIPIVLNTNYSWVVIQEEFGTKTPFKKNNHEATVLLGIVFLEFFELMYMFKRTLPITIL